MQPNIHKGLQTALYNSYNSDISCVLNNYYNVIIPKYPMPC